MVRYIISIVVIVFSTLVCADKAPRVVSKKEAMAIPIIINDPTQPLGYKINIVSKKVYRRRLPTLQGIVLKNDKRRVIIKNQYYDVGQTVDGYKITRIEKEVAYLVYQSKTYTISLYSNSERFTQ